MVFAALLPAAALCACDGSPVESMPPSPAGDGDTRVDGAVDGARVRGEAPAQSGAGPAEAEAPSPSVESPSREPSRQQEDVAGNQSVDFEAAGGVPEPGRGEPPGGENSSSPDSAPADSDLPAADSAQPVEDSPAPGATPAAPAGAFGNDTPGGRGGAVIRVTSLDSQGPGSLREALDTPGPRIVVFEVGGIIDLERERLNVVEPFVTLAGQTAPSPGITLIRGGLRVRTHDVRVEHVRFRMGDAGATVPGSFEPDVTTDGAQAHDVVFDHVSVAWGVDENLSVSGPRFDGVEGTSRRVTIRDSIIAEGLNESVHEKGAHSMGTLIHDYCTDIAVVGNLYAHNDERNPWFKAFASGVIVNNVVYNPGRWAMRLGAVNGEWEGSGVTPEGPRVSIIGNVLRHGPDTPADRAMVDTNSSGFAYLEDNVVVTALGAPGVVASPAVTRLAAPGRLPSWVAPLPSSAVVDRVVAQAGARPTDRDAVDERIVADFLAGTGTLLNGQDEVGGYPTAQAVVRLLSVPDDVDAWLGGLSAELEGRVGAP